MSKLRHILILFLLTLISAQSIYKCKTKDTENKVEIGDEVTLCVHVTESRKKVAFKLKVDEYSVISIKKGFSKIVLPKEGQSQVRRLKEENEESPSEEPSSGTGENPSSGAGDNPSSGAGDNPSSGAGDNPSSGTGDNPSSGTGENPPSGSGENPPSGSGENPPSGSGENPPSGSGDENPPSGSGDENPPSGSGDENPPSGDSTSQIKEEFVSQIGNVTTKYSTVS
jgi:hypothetical protein